METEVFTTQSYNEVKKRRISMRKKILLGVTTLILVSVAVSLSIVYGKNKKNVQDESEMGEDFGYSLQQKPWFNMRLPNAIVPSSYELILNVSMDVDTYRGQVNIIFTAEEATNYVIFHQVDLHITHINIYQRNAILPERRLKSFSYKPNEFYVVEMVRPLKKGKTYTMHILFNGGLRSELSGFYKSYYQEGKSKRKVASTFFSPISARKAFPCFDEPKFKATFKLSLTHSDEYHAIANMGPSWQYYKNGSVTTFFQTSIKMSTYIVCWVISDFKSIKPEIHNSQVQLRAWASLKNLPDMKFGLESSERLLKYYEKYFQIKFPLKKLDVVAVPNFGPGAMENWGVITYRSSSILYNQQTTSEEQKQAIFSIIAHETVHQWFGNLATMMFWNEAWLKEGFANYIGRIGADQLEPSMELLKHAQAQYMIPAFEIDSYSTSHPISQIVNTPAEVRQMFDTITYNKGHCMVQMLHEYLGNDFQRGLQRYLTTFSYKNADQDDLWRELSLASNKDVKSVMDTWTLQLGHPVITATRLNNTHVHVEQKRFSLDPPGTVEKPSPFNYLWQVPLSYIDSKDGKVKTHLLTTVKDIVTIPTGSIFNPKHAMFYRVNYKGEMLKMIKSKMEHDDLMLASQDKVGLIYNQFTLAAANLSEIKHALDMTKLMKNEGDFYPWDVTIDQLSMVLRFTDDKRVREELKLYIRNITHDIVNRIGWKQVSTVNDVKLQVKLLTTTCRMGVQQVITQAKTMYSQWMSGQALQVDANLQETIRHCAIYNGGVKEWEYALKKYLEGGSDKDALLTSLTATRDEKLIKRLLAYTKNNTVIDSQDSPYVIGGIASNSEIGRDLAWSHMKTNWIEIFGTYNTELFLLGRMMTEVLTQFSTQNHLNDIVTFFSQLQSLGSGKQAYEQSILKIKSNIQWKKINARHVVEWLNVNYKKLSIVGALK